VTEIQAPPNQHLQQFNVQAQRKKVHAVETEQQIQAADVTYINFNLQLQKQ
jgi:hypothetical protein